ncbi:MULTISPECIES: preprotein translocase subunit SecG [Dictyoglomus]|jgi:preprotein translocase subunit SecG|uniref:Protein-export membrane protein SecG n=3 Tax=Dictyoglomus TaxID=13 RepID=B8E2R3_DICTD|nr:MULTISPECIES: preprotein translocase subunit SecG [Dictyoglomus]ACI19369.1 preprotein translocase, SecG subunit [Dictyoglomus thermophilum H-6-12]ACK42413.1 preprotein translocase, SecG subunit [Dictyoglomus turgidum DSM 6724]PNV80712.1 MAG: preprotein translocase subunit SecG [Dictyoglomus turgidum]TYT22464.1 preprotein translocase subunit SecG [Dictyoglomus thermophilum]HBU32131.1 preprotein translocase subunit SecG [Dictyoglomus sp.]
MTIVLYILHFLVSIGMIAVILFQSEVGEGLGFIGGGETTFYKAKRQMEKGLKQATVVLAVLFMITSVLIFVIH